MPRCLRAGACPDWLGVPSFLLTLLCLLPSASAQQAPHIGYVYPAGGRQGTTFQVTVGGQFVDGTSEARISGTGIKATVIEMVKPISQQQATLLREKLRELQDKKFAAARVERPSTVPATGPATAPSTKPIFTAEDEKLSEDIRKKLATFIPRNQLNPAIAETVTLQVTITSTTEPGEHDLRLKTPFGFTNPLTFCVGQLPEFSRDRAKMTREPRNSPGARATAPEAEMAVTLPATINGQIMPGDAHRIRFAARKGQHLVAMVNARSLMPYLADAVPGWFQATLALTDAAGKELAYSDHYRFSPDPVLHYQVLQDGNYFVEIKDSLYRGREDFVYRISLGELPFITGIFPAGGRVNMPTTVELTGWNLPSPSTLTTTPRSAGTTLLSVANGNILSNRVPFAADTLAECLDQGSNSQPSSAQAVALPIIINGRIALPGQRHGYRFEGQAGQSIVAEVTARRIASPLDSILTLTDASGKQLAANDDFVDKSAGLITHQADSFLTTTLPAAGTYTLHIADTQQQGGPDYTYRLRISTPRPDYELRVTPSSINARGGTSAALTVYAIRKDNFTGEIALLLKDAPAGFALGGGKIPANQDQARITLTIPPSATREHISPHIEGHATIQGREVLRIARPCEDMMQAFVYHHLVLAQEFLLAVFERPAIRKPLTLLDATPVKIPVNGIAKLHIALPLAVSASDGRFELADPPAGLTIQSVSASPQGVEIVLKYDATKTRPGFKGNLIISAFTERSAPDDKTKIRKLHIPLGTLPAIPFVITER